MVGCLDAVTHTGEAVRAMAGGLSSGDSALSARRSRFPQPFGPDGRIMPRTTETACGALLLARFPFWKVSDDSCVIGAMDDAGGGVSVRVYLIPIHGAVRRCSLVWRKEGPLSHPTSERGAAIGGSTFFWRKNVSG